MGQCSNRASEGAEEFAPHAVSLEKAKSLSSNAAVTAARYHYSQGGKKLADDYKVDGTVLGQGLCGDVVLVLGKIDNRRYAMKTIRKTQVASSKLQQLTAEVEIYLTLDHPNIARLHDVYETEADICLLTECCEGGELYFRLQKRGVYTDSDAAEAARQMLRAVGYLHSHRIVHRDLKLENFLYESEDSASQLKLIDFGFAKVWDPSTLMMASCGSIAYVSPDVLQGKGYTNKCDLWSLGVIVWMLLSGYPPFHGDEKLMMAKIKAGQADWSHKSRWKPVSDNAIDFLKKLLNKDPQQRMSAQEALRHPWLARGATTGHMAVLSRDALRSLQRYADASRVRRAVLQLLAQELGPDETKDLREIFLAIDKSNEGTICLRDLKDAIRSGGGRSPTRTPSRWKKPAEAASGSPSALQVSVSGNFLQVPTGDSAHGQSPFSGSSVGSPTTPARTLRRAPSGMLDDLFCMLDANGDERIYYSDFLAATMQARSRLREEAVRATFHRLDADGSGSISVQDFRAVLGETFEGVDVEELIKEADPVRRGEITFEGFVQVLEDHDAVPTSPTQSPKMRPPSSSAQDRRTVGFFPEEAH
mmetsp:Transcript_82515/g.246051  ORF Transcript_82515/g.246051 Transcript_82515/m.246051 type:complete len:589 (-) Transcript_82515:112-1878(-)